MDIHAKGTSKGTDTSRPFMLHVYSCCMYPRSLDEFIEGTISYSKHAVSAKRLCWVTGLDQCRLLAETSWYGTQRILAVLHCLSSA